ncbi:MAG: hypothetical protein DRJ38_09315 [Thermoprotei archaeon]|nr:MAG: hypothetical protein DRJ38_09315 [Thermoprotei archaeon]
MTGPGEGKIPLKAIVELCSRTTCIPIDCDLYLHVKGYSLARVTHIDLEADILNRVVKPRSSQYCRYSVSGNYINLYLRNHVYVNELNITVRKIKISCKELIDALGDGTRSWVYLGGKYGGVFLGFKKPQVEKLEDLARKLGVAPRK